MPVALVRPSATRPVDELVYGSKYRRNGYVITRLKKYRKDRLEKYPRCLVVPTKGWYPSKMANFIFGFGDKPTSWYMSLVPRYFNASLWESKRHEGMPVLRVPKDREEETRQFLNRANLWFNGAKNLWLRRQHNLYYG
jgi:hypothetical protein